MENNYNSLVTLNRKSWNWMSKLKKDQNVIIVLAKFDWYTWTPKFKPSPWELLLYQKFLLFYKPNVCSKEKFWRWHSKACITLPVEVLGKPAVLVRKCQTRQKIQFKLDFKCFLSYKVMNSRSYQQTWNYKTSWSVEMQISLFMRVAGVQQMSKWQKSV